MGSERGIRDRLGEAFLRVALATELDDERAARAAGGWGNDTRIAFNDESGARSYAWVVRFDAAANASTFDEAVGTYLDRRTGSGPLVDDRPGRRWSGTVDDRRVAYRLVRTDDRTAVLLLGEPGFVDAGNDGEAVQGEMYETARRHDIEVGDFFQAGYRLFFDQPQGPRLGEFLGELDTEFVVARLRREA